MEAVAPVLLVIDSLNVSLITGTINTQLPPLNTVPTKFAFSLIGCDGVAKLPRSKGKYPPDGV